MTADPTEAATELMRLHRIAVTQSILGAAGCHPDFARNADSTFNTALLAALSARDAEIARLAERLANAKGAIITRDKMLDARDAEIARLRALGQIDGETLGELTDENINAAAEIARLKAEVDRCRVLHERWRVEPVTSLFGEQPAQSAASTGGPDAD